MTENTDGWEPVLSYVVVTLIDGTISRPTAALMRRKVEGGYEYRLPTDDEFRDDASEDAW